MDDKKVLFSGIQPSGTLTLGNYLGAVKNWAKLQQDYSCLFCVVDMHAITVRQTPAELRQNSLSLLALLLASGLDPEKNLIFIQSHVSAHAELGWILNCNTMFGELSRMTQFKDKSAKNESNINAGLFTYPSLMAADILLYQTDLVPVGKDQTQHLELTRDIALRFNGLYGETFKVPEGYYPKMGAKVMSLQEPNRKMSKSDENQNSFVAMLDKKDDIIRKFKRAVTDSDMSIRYGENKDGINNLLTIYSAVTGKTISETEQEFEGRGYGDFKLAVGEAVDKELSPIREKYDELMKEKEYLKSVYTKSAETASYLALKTLRKVYKKVGFIPKG